MFILPRSFSWTRKAVECWPAMYLFSVLKRRGISSKTKVTMLVGLLLLLLSWQARPDLAQSTGRQMTWRYECSNGNCYRNETPSVSPTDSASSISICRLSCDQYGGLWPRPQEITLSNLLVETHPSLAEFNFDGVTGGSAPKMFLKRAAERLLGYWESALVRGGGGGTPLSQMARVSVNLKTTSPDLALNLSTSEAYSIGITTLGRRVWVEINGTTVYGVRGGLETLGQLGEPWEGKLFLVGGGSIKDFPSFPHRGILLDTSRHFLQLSTLKRTLDAMASSKLNVLHWHATDSHSFPLVLPSFPEMSTYGAYSNEEIYTTEAIKDVIEYAQDRGIRIMFELDTPSHSGNGWQWGESAGLGKLAVCINQQPWRSYCIQPPCGQLNPVNKNLYTILGRLYKDIQDLFSTENMFHMGGDEVFFPCWNSTAEITDWMKSKGLSRTKEGFLELWGRFQRGALDEWDKGAGHSQTPIVLWSSHLTDPQVIEKYLDPKRYIIETWVDSADNLPEVLLSKGYKLILVTKDAWYFDHGFDGNTNFHTWKTVYNSKMQHHKGVLGGEGCIWGELVDDHSLDGKLWPRAAALAERLWTDPHGPKEEEEGGSPGSGALESEPRLEQHRERLLRMGLRPATIAPQWCQQNDRLC